MSEVNKISQLGLKFETFFSYFWHYRAEAQPLINRIEQGLNKGDILEISFIKDIMLASKGDTILVCPRRWFIVVNLRYERLVQIFRELNDKASRIKSITFKVQVIKDNPERKYVLCKLLEARIDYEIEREDSIEKFYPQEDIEFDSVIFTRTLRKLEIYRLRGSGTLTILPETYNFTEKIESRELVRVFKDEKVMVREVKDENTLLGRVVKKLNEYIEGLRRKELGGELEVWCREGDRVLKIRLFPWFSGNVSYDISIYEDPLPSEEDLLELSKFYVIKIPKFYMNNTIRRTVFENLNEVKRVLYVLDVYYNGKKFEVVVKGLSEIPKPLRASVVRRRFAISKYAKLHLPRKFEGSDYFLFKYFESDKSLKDFVEEVKQIINVRNFKPKDVSFMETFLEIFFEKTPKRKLKLIEPYIKILNEVKDYAEKSALYVIFHGQKDEWGRRHLPNYKAFRITPVTQDIYRITVDNQPPVPTTAIVLKGGEFEKRYRDAFNIDNLLTYQCARIEEKVEMIKLDCYELRKRLEQMGINVAEIPFKELVNKIEELARSEEYPQNLVLVFYKYCLDAKKDDWTTDWVHEVAMVREILAGLVKSGRDRDFTLERLEKVLRAMRVAVLWSMKTRGYSKQLGVIFTGNPESILRKILEFVRRLEGRVLALKLELGNEEEAKRVEEFKDVLSDRVKALMEELIG